MIRVVVQTLVLLAVALVTLVLLLLATGHAPGPALSAMASGAFGSSYALLSATPVRAIPLALAGLAVAIAFRAGILNVGAEGQLLVGATAAACVAALAMASPGLPALLVIVAMLAAGTLAGGLWAGIAAWLRARFGVLEVISTIMLNLIAHELVGYLVRGPLQEPTRTNPQSSTLVEALHLPVLVEGSRLHAGLLLAIGLAVLAWWWLRNTASGFRLRAVGGNASAAASAGRVNVPRVVAGAFLTSGALAGVAGAVQYSGVTFAMYENFSPGYGYKAIAVALLARLNPLGVLVAALLFGALEAGANAMERDAGVPNVVVSVVEAALILLVVAADRWRARTGNSTRE
ncbi:MAG TPA: ABC transporter permease [Gemmatimonas sp.]|nr:ABC transporter permease [Gemmatimonas sp.]